MKYSSLGEHSNIVYKVGYTCTGINTSGILTTRLGKGGNILSLQKILKIHSLRKFNGEMMYRVG